MIIIEVVLFICLAGFFDGMMDNIKDSTANWLYVWCTKHPTYLGWYKYGSHIPLPFIKKYNPKYPWSSDGWHMMKHFMILAYTGAIACFFAYAIGMYFHLEWYYEIGIQLISWTVFDWLESVFFNKTYRG